LIADDPLARIAGLGRGDEVLKRPDERLFKDHLRFGRKKLFRQHGFLISLGLAEPAGSRLTGGKRCYKLLAQLRSPYYGIMSQKSRRETPIKIAGAGPSGLAAAITLAKAGHEVEIFEARPAVGARFIGDFQVIENM